MNILIINYEYPPIGGGASNASYHIAKALVELGHQASVITSAFENKRGYTVEENIHVYRIPAMRKLQHRSNIKEMMSFVLSAYWHLGKIVRVQQIEKSIIFFTIPSGILGPFLKRRYKVPYIVSLRGGDVPGLETGLIEVHKKIRVLRQNILRKAINIVANSKGLAAASLQHDPFPVQVIPNGVDTDFYFSDVSKREKKSNVDFLFVGRFQEQKNLFFLLEQFAAFAKQNDHVNLILVGDGPQKSDLMKHAEKSEISNKVTWKGWTDKEGLRNLYQQADCLINPSLYEGMPNVVLEGMACGLPVIASNIMGNDELVKNGENGFLFDLNQTDQLQEALSAVYSDKEKRQSMGVASRKIAETEYSWKKVAESYLKLLN